MAGSLGLSLAAPEGVKWLKYQRYTQRLNQCDSAVDVCTVHTIPYLRTGIGAVDGCDAGPGRSVEVCSPLRGVLTSREYKDGNGFITDNMRMQESNKDQLISDFSKLRSYLRL